MNTPFEGLPQGADRIVYVREVAVGDLPDEVREQVGDAQVIWSVMSWARSRSRPARLPMAPPAIRG